MYFLIKDLERFSGIKAHVIRTWEQRYKILNPLRTKNNIRQYSIEDVSFLMNITLLVTHGRKISNIAVLSSKQIEDEITRLKTIAVRQQKYIFDLILNMLSSDTEEFEATLDKCIISWGIDTTIEKVIIPFLEKVDILSYSRTNIETHFVVTAIRSKLILGIEKTILGDKKNKSALLYLPEGEHYDLILLYINYILRLKGIRVFYLGTNISINNLKKAIAEKQPDLLFSYAANKVFPYNEYCELLEQNFPDLPLFIGCHEGSNKYNKRGLVNTFKFDSVHSTVE